MSAIWTWCRWCAISAGGTLRAIDDEAAARSAFIASAALEKIRRGS
jgi:hypothetical protein